MSTAVTTHLPDALAQRVRANDTTAAAAVFTLVKESMPPALEPGERYRTPAGEVAEVVGFRAGLVILFFPGRTDPGSSAGAMPLAGVQEQVANGRWVRLPPPEPETPPVAAWVAGQQVAVGDLRTYHGTTYRVLQAHTTQADWTPPAVPALWVRA